MILSQVLPSVQALKGNFENGHQLQRKPQQDDAKTKEFGRAKLIRIAQEKNYRYPNETELQHAKPVVVAEVQAVNENSIDAKNRFLPDVTAITEQFEAKSRSGSDSSGSGLAPRSTPFSNSHQDGGSLSTLHKRHLGTENGSFSVDVLPPSGNRTVHGGGEPLSHPSQRVVSSTTAYLNGGVSQLRRESAPVVSGQNAGRAPNSRRMAVAVKNGVPVKVDTPWVMKKSNVPVVAGTGRFRNELNVVNCNKIEKINNDVANQATASDAPLTSAAAFHSKSSAGFFSQMGTVDISELAKMNTTELRQNYQFKVDLNNPEQMMRIEHR